jgi:hypothetical protein
MDRHFYKGQHRAPSERQIRLREIRRALVPITSEHDFSLLDELLENPERAISTALLR